MSAIIQKVFINYNTAPKLVSWSCYSIWIKNCLNKKFLNDFLNFKVDFTRWCKALSHSHQRVQTIWNPHVCNALTTRIAWASKGHDLALTRQYGFYNLPCISMFLKAHCTLEISESALMKTVLFRNRPFLNFRPSNFNCCAIKQHVWTPQMYYFQINT